MKNKLITLAKEEWWDSLTREEQLKYLEKNEGSKYANKVKPAETKHTSIGVPKDKTQHINKLPIIERSVEDKKVFELAKQDGVAIPPAWRNVSYYSKEGNEKGIVAEGTDGKGRKQRLENAEYRENQIKLKHQKISETLTPKMPKIIAHLKRNMQNDPDTYGALYLLTQTAFRIGDKGDGKSDKTFGGSNLQGRHVKTNPDNDVIEFDFIGKGGVRQQHTIKDKLLANIFKEKETHEDESVFSNTNPDQIRKLWKKLGGDKVHDLRSHLATVEAKKVLDKFGPVTTQKEYKSLLKAASEAAAKKLGNKPAESLKTYIDQSIFDHINIDE